MSHPKISIGSSNQKTGPLAVTYASIAHTCPRDCGMREACYASTGHLVAIQRHVSKGHRPITSGIDSARYEARIIRDAIRKAPRGMPLRIHGSGDCSTPAQAREVGAAGADWVAKVRAPAYTYTHAWRKVPRSAWGKAVSVLASMEDHTHAAAAMARGYAPARVVAEHPSDGKATTDAHGVKWIPCPAQTRDVTCDKCRLCFDGDTLLARKAGITFAAHGATRKRALSVIR